MKLQGFLGAELGALEDDKLTGFLMDWDKRSHRVTDESLKENAIKRIIEYSWHRDVDENDKLEWCINLLGYARELAKKEGIDLSPEHVRRSANELHLRAG